MPSWLLSNLQGPFLSFFVLFPFILHPVTNNDRLPNTLRHIDNCHRKHTQRRGQHWPLTEAKESLHQWGLSSLWTEVSNNATGGGLLATPRRLFSLHAALQVWLRRGNFFMDQDTDVLSGQESLNATLEFRLHSSWPCARKRAGNVLRRTTSMPR